MCIKKYCILLILLLLGIGIAHSQENRTEISVDFRVNSTVIDFAYSGNIDRIQEIIDFLRAIRQDSTVNIVEVSFCGAASPEGSAQQNRRLARSRLEALEKIIRREVDIPDSLITRNDNYIPWDYLKSQIEGSGLVSKDKVIAILEEEARLVDYYYPYTHIDNRIVKLKALDGGVVWQQMNSLFFEQMRNASVVFVTHKKELPPVEEPETEVVAVAETAPDTAATAAPIAPEVEEWAHKLHLKTNAIGLGMGIANVAVEIDMARHWSFALPVYYSAWDYFKQTVKFRTFAVQPEFRYWFCDRFSRHFIGAHLIGGVFNFGGLDNNLSFLGTDFSVLRDHRYQGYAYGAGAAYGFAFMLSKHLNLELEAGFGYICLDYDMFECDGCGRQTYSGIHHYIGPTKAAVNLVFLF